MITAMMGPKKKKLEDYVLHIPYCGQLLTFLTALAAGRSPINAPVRNRKPPTGAPSYSYTILGLVLYYLPAIYSYTRILMMSHISRSLPSVHLRIYITRSKERRKKKPRDRWRAPKFLVKVGWFLPQRQDRAIYLAWVKDMMFSIYEQNSPEVAVVTGPCPPG